MFTRKGLSISLNGKRIPSLARRCAIKTSDPSNTIRKLCVPRGASGFSPRPGCMKAIGLRIWSPITRRTVTSEIAKEQGWYVVCNDRIILVADRTTRTGWTTGWHNEYAGFLGWVHYVAADPELLPWDSKKSGINESSEAHRESVAWLKTIADDFRSQKNKLRDRGGRQGGDQRPRATPSRASSTPQRQPDAAPDRGSPSASLLAPPNLPIPKRIPPYFISAKSRPHRRRSGRSRMRRQDWRSGTSPTVQRFSCAPSSRLS